MKLNYILPKNHLASPGRNSSAKVCLVLHLYYEDQLDQMLGFAKNMPAGTYIISVTPKDEMKPLLEQKLNALGYEYEIIIMENRGRDVSALLVAAYPKLMEFDYVCFVHDKKSNYIKPYINGVSFLYQCMENLLGSQDYVQNVVNLFDRNEKLGMLMPPPPCHGDYYQIISSEWAGDFPGTVELANKLNLHVNIDGGKPPITPLGTMFWFRPNAMKTLFNAKWEFSDFPVEPNGNDATILHFVERIYGFVCQNDGYYPAWAMTDHFANIYLNNLYFMLRELNLKMFPHFWPRHIFDMVNRFDTCVAHVDEIKQKNIQIEQDVLEISKRDSEINRLNKEIQQLIPYTSYKFHIKRAAKKVVPYWFYNLVKVVYRRIRRSR